MPVKNKPKRPQQKKRKGVSQEAMRRLLMGDTRAGLRQKVSKPQYRRLVRTARRRGLTLEGMVSGQPSSLKERSTAGLRKEAVRTVNAAYGAAEKDLDNQDARIRALDSKRALDNANWRNWMAGEATRMEQVSRQANERLTQNQAEIQNQVNTIWEGAKQAARSSVQQNTGYVSDPGESTSLDFTDEHMRDVQKVAAARTHTNEIIGAGNRKTAALSANNFAVAASMEARRAADTWNALRDVADDRDKVRLSKAADSAKEVSRLVDREIDKANSNREFSAALQKLGLEAQEQRFERKDANRKFGLAKKELRRKISKDQIDARLKAIGIELDKAELGEKVRHNLQQERKDLLDLRRKSAKDKADIRLDKQKLAQGGAGGGTAGGLTPSKRLSYRDKYDGIRSKMKLYGTDAGALKLRKEGAPELLIRAGQEAQGKGLRSSTIRKVKEKYGFTPKGKRYKG